MGLFPLFFRNFLYLSIENVDYSYSCKDEDSTQDSGSAYAIIFEEDITKENDKYRIGDFNQSCSCGVFPFDGKDDNDACY